MLVVPDMNGNGVAEVALLTLSDGYPVRGADIRDALELATERARLQEELAKLDVGVVPSQANFVFVDARRPGRELYQELLKKGVIVRPLGQTSFLRITVGTADENTRALAALKEVLA